MQTEPISCGITLEGLVQGVGFRPLLYQLAQDFCLQGWVMNTGLGLKMEVQAADREVMEAFLQSIRTHKPAGSIIERMQVDRLDVPSLGTFEIRASRADEVTTHIPLDVATCSSCRDELFDPGNRRYLYPFISCASCGPRFTIMKKLPFDRAQTSLDAFPLCDECREEYMDPQNRRFHAQTLSCPRCGPTLSFMHPWGKIQGEGAEAILAAGRLLREGGVLALKGIGGYQLAVLASHNQAVACLRQRKSRPEKPLALMFPDLASIGEVCVLNQQEKELLLSPANPIVLLSQKNKNTLPASLSWDLPLCGAMLPGSPLHWLLLREVGQPLVMTSANPPGAPIIIDEEPGYCALQKLADGGLVHNRPILHRADDSILRSMAGEAVSIRRGRGLAPYVIEVPWKQAAGVAVGGQQKNTFALQKGHKIIVSQHIGHLESQATADFLQEEIAAFSSLFHVKPQWAVHDSHPDYQSTHIARNIAPHTLSIQHHRAHVWACAAEHQPIEKCLAVAWDGSGLGDDGTIWGGEFFLWDPESPHPERIGSLLSFPLIGGDRAAREPRRCALGLATVLFGIDLDPLFLQKFPDFEPHLLKGVIQQANCFIKTSSVARLFDALASLLDIRQICSFEGQAAMLLESLVDPHHPFQPYEMSWLQAQPIRFLDWRSMFMEILQDLTNRVPAAVIASRFHHSLVAALEAFMQQLGLKSLMLSGGVFQNRVLLETIKRRADAAGWQVWSQARIPPNDAGLAVGQLTWALQQEMKPCV